MAHATHHHHDGHGHGHDHARGHGHHHAPAVAAVPAFSLLRASAVQRLMLAAAPLAVLWILVWWALS